MSSPSLRCHQAVEVALRLMPQVIESSGSGLPQPNRLRISLRLTHGAHPCDVEHWVRCSPMRWLKAHPQSPSPPVGLAKDGDRPPALRRPMYHLRHELAECSLRSRTVTHAFQMLSRPAVLATVRLPGRWSTRRLGCSLT
jgi:hypothetical protein